MLDRITAINGTTFWIALAAVFAGAQLDSTPVMVTASLILLGSTATAILTTAAATPRPAPTKEFTMNTTKNMPVWADVLGYWVPGSPWRRAWAESRTIDDHGELVARWLEGEYRFTPGHVGPPDDETAAIVPDLVRLNRAGLVTLSSQPGATDVDDDGPWVQRAFVTAYGTPATVSRAARAAAAAGLWVQSWPQDADVDTMPDVAPLTFQPGSEEDAEITFTELRTPTDPPPPAWDNAVAWHPDSRRAWRDAARLAVVDPEPGRERLLWDTLTAAIETPAATR